MWDWISAWKPVFLWLPRHHSEVSLFLSDHSLHLPQVPILLVIPYISGFSNFQPGPDSPSPPFAISVPTDLINQTIPRFVFSAQTVHPPGCFTGTSNSVHPKWNGTVRFLHSSTFRNLLHPHLLKGQTNIKIPWSLPYHTASIDLTCLLASTPVPQPILYTKGRAIFYNSNLIILKSLQWPCTAVRIKSKLPATAFKVLVDPLFCPSLTSSPPTHYTCNV